MSEIFTQRWVVLLEERVYLSIGAGHFSSEFMRHFDTEFSSIIDASTAPLVHLISDSRHVLSLPSLPEIMKNSYPTHPRMGYNLTIGAFHNPMMRFLLSFSTAVTNTRYKDVLSLAEACAFIAHRDPSLPPLAQWNIPSEGDLKP